MEKQMPCPTQRIDESICGMADCTPDVYRDLFSSEYISDVIYNHPERIQKIQPILDS